MSPRRYITFVTVVAGLTLCPSPNAATVLSFDNPSFVGAQDPYGPGMGFTEQGFLIWNSSNDGSIIRFDPTLNDFTPNNGSIHFGATLFALPSVRSIDGSPFTLLSIDLAHYSKFFATDSVTLQGNYEDGRRVMQTFEITFDFNTYNFPATWTHLKSVDFVSYGMAWDNVSITSIPEPTAGALLSCSFLLIILSRCQKQAEQSGRREDSPPGSHTTWQAGPH